MLDSPLISSDELPSLLEAFEHGLVRVSGQRVAGASPALARMAGLPADELAGRTIDELFVDPGDRPVTRLEPGDGYQLRDLQGRLRPVSLRRVSDALWLVVDRERESRLEREVWRLASDHGDAREQSQRTSVRSVAEAEPLRGEQNGMI